MANLHQIVTTGYKDLAKRGLKLIDQIKFPKELNRVHIEGKLTLDYVEHLKKGLKSLKKNGNPLESFDISYYTLFPAVIDALEKLIQEEDNLISDFSEMPEVPEEYKSLNTSLIAANYFYEIPKSSNIVKELGISNIFYTNKNPSIQTLFLDDGTTKKVFNARYNPISPASTFLSNCHEIRHAMQEESQKLVNIVNEFYNIENMIKLVEHIHDIKELKKKYYQVSNQFHLLKFYDDPEIKKLAESFDIDMNKYNSYLENNLVYANYLKSIMEGDAYANQHKILEKHPKIQKNPKLKTLFEFLSIVSIIETTTIDDLKKYYIPGIGIGEYLSTRPDMKEKLKMDTPLHRQITQKYFK